MIPKPYEMVTVCPSRLAISIMALASSLNAIGQLKMAGNDSGNGDVFIEGFPPQGIAIESQDHLLQLLFGSFGQNFESVCGKANDTPIGEFNIDHSLFRPSPDSGRFDGFIRIVSGSTPLFLDNLTGSSQNLHSPLGVSTWMCGGSFPSSE
jgi:hypothetical protein